MVKYIWIGDMIPMDNELLNARKVFISRHKEWLGVNNPKGFETGVIRTTFHNRTAALLVLVRKQEPYRKIIQLLKSPRNT